LSLDYFRVADLSDSVRKTIEFDVELLNLIGLRLKKIITNNDSHINHETGAIKFENKRICKVKAYSSNPVHIKDRRLQTTKVNNYQFSQLTSIFTD